MRGAILAAVIGVAVVAHGAQIGGVIVAHHPSLAFAQSVLIMLTAIVIGCGLTRSSGSLKATRVALVEELRGERRDHDGGVDRLVAHRDRHLGERQHLDVDVRDREAVGLQHLADLVGRDRARAVAGDDLALELREPRDLALEVGPQHQVVAERARHPVHHDA